LTESVYGVELSLTDSIDVICEVIFLDKFFSLPNEKQKIIIDAALRTFGANGYKKASTNDIAFAAGVSKAMIFHYFGTKKNYTFI